MLARQALHALLQEPEALTYIDFNVQPASAPVLPSLLFVRGQSGCLPCMHNLHKDLPAMLEILTMLPFVLSRLGMAS